MNTIPQDSEQLRAAVRERYTQAISTLDVKQSDAASCCDSSTGCGSGCCSTKMSDPITVDLYSDKELGEVPLAARLASLGCGNPTALAKLRPGEKVLDLGSGGGIDVLLSAKRVGPTGFVYGLDMTDAMLTLAEHNRQEAKIENVQFLKGVIEHIPLAENSVDVVISNCVVNLSADKGQVLREAYRILTPGGRLAIADIVFQGHFPEALRHDLEGWAGCIAGALEEKFYRQLLQDAGFVDVNVEVIRRYSLQDVADSGAATSIATLADSEQQNIDGKFVSAFICAYKTLDNA